jgi:hypothetical protein
MEIDNSNAGPGAFSSISVASASNGFNMYKYGSGYTGTVLLGIVTKADACALSGEGEVAVGSTSNNILRLSTNNTSRMTISGAGAIDFAAIPTIPTTAPTTAGQIVSLDAGAKLPAVDASQVTKLPAQAVILATRDLAATTGTVTYAHGLGVAPSWVRIDFDGNKAGYDWYGHGFYNGTNQYSISACTNANYATSSATQIIHTISGTDGQDGIVSVDATNISIAWTKVNSGIASVTANLLITAGK